MPWVSAHEFLTEKTAARIEAEALRYAHTIGVARLHEQAQQHERRGNKIYLEQVARERREDERELKQEGN